MFVGIGQDLIKILSSYLFLKIQEIDLFNLHEEIHDIQLSSHDIIGFLNLIYPSI